ncbi:MAG TPA: hypothetical protein VF045_03540 [Acidimicrobiales bacterium]
MKELGVPITGVDRVGWVRIELRDSGPVCHVVGTTRRRMIERPVPLATATALMARGVPSVVRHPSNSRPVAART